VLRWGGPRPPAVRGDGLSSADGASRPPATRETRKGCPNLAFLLRPGNGGGGLPLLLFVWVTEAVVEEGAARGDPQGHG
jgi:hypothetical protein